MTPRLLIALACAGLAAPAAAEPLAGLYHLAGPRGSASGTGGSNTAISELLLDDDGRYAWMLVASGRDATSSGTWKREGETVVLLADRAPPVAAPFKLASDPPLRAWDAAAEQALADVAWQARRDEVVAACPFLDVRDAAAPVPPAPSGGSTPSRAALEKRVGAAEARLSAATAALERAAAEAVRRPAPRGAAAKASAATPAMVRATAAMDRWQGAWLELREAHLAAHLPPPARPEPRLPAACALPPERDVARQDPKGWAGGHGVQVGSPDGEPVGQVRVEFTFGDSKAARATTDKRHGLAVVPLRPGAPLRSLTLTASLEGGRELSQALPLPAGAEQGGVVRVELDATSLIRSPFERMVLTVVEGGLRSSDPAGLYRRD